ncbi:ICE2-domain-containing protein [Dipodascopsis uninucleata]
MSSLWTAFHVFTNFVYLSLIILTVPLAFDVGGEECGLAFTLTLTIFYFSVATIKLLGRNTKFSHITNVFYYFQHVIIPSLFIMYLNIYSNPDCSYPIGSKLIFPWRYFLQNATAGFAVLEGFCTLLVIQAIGQISRWLVNNRSDTWMIVMLLTSGIIISNACYFLYRVYTFPIVLTVGNATIIGVLLTCTTFIGGYGVTSGKGNMIESSLLFSYMVYCIYEAFTDFQSSEPIIETKTEFPPFPPIIMESYATIVSSLASTVPQSFKSVFELLFAAMSTITPSIVVSLTYRLTVLFAATQIIPTIRDSSKNDANYNESRLKGLFYVVAYAPCVLIAVYSNLLMKHFGFLSKPTKIYDFQIDTWQLWSWVNSAVTLIIYASEIIYGKESRNESLTRHWKTE